MLSYRADISQIQIFFFAALVYFPTLIGFADLLRGTSNIYESMELNACIYMRRKKMCFTVYVWWLFFSTKCIMIPSMIFYTMHSNTLVQCTFVKIWVTDQCIYTLFKEEVTNKNWPDTKIQVIFNNFITSIIRERKTIHRSFRCILFLHFTYKYG